jgi:hypothetical protein
MFLRKLSTLYSRSEFAVFILAEFELAREKVGGAPIGFWGVLLIIKVAGLATCPVSDAFLCCDFTPTS